MEGSNMQRMELIDSNLSNFSFSEEAIEFCSPFESVIQGADYWLILKQGNILIIISGSGAQIKSRRCEFAAC